MSEKVIKDFIDETVSRYPLLANARNDIMNAFELLKLTFLSSHKLLVCGNGGSAADCEHIVAELMNRFAFKRVLADSTRDTLKAQAGDSAIETLLQPSLRAISLTSQTALTTAIANDLGAELVFAQQVLGYGDENDVLLAISTSGNSPNVINAIRTAKALKMKTIILTGNKLGPMDSMADVLIKVEASITSEIQELHLPVYHTLCRMLEETFFDKEG